MANFKSSHKEESRRFEKRVVKYPISGGTLSSEFKNKVVEIFSQRTNVPVTKIRQVNAITCTDGIFVFTPKSNDVTYINEVKSRSNGKSGTDSSRKFGSFNESILIEKKASLTLLKGAAAKLKSEINDMLTKATGSRFHELKRSYNEKDLYRLQSWIRFIGHGLLSLGEKPSTLIYRLMFSQPSLDVIMFNDMSQMNQEWYKSKEPSDLLESEFNFVDIKGNKFKMFEKVSMYDVCTEFIGHRAYLLILLQFKQERDRPTNKRAGRSRVIKLDDSSSDDDDDNVKSAAAMKMQKEVKTTTNNVDDEPIVAASAIATSGASPLDQSSDTE